MHDSPSKGLWRDPGAHHGKTRPAPIYREYFSDLLLFEGNADSVKPPTPLDRNHDAER